MRELMYRGWRVEARGQALASGEWSPRALVWRDRELHHYRLPRPNRPGAQRTFGTEGEADAYAEQLARAWIDENG
jgi:hypothetical protein